MTKRNGIIKLDSAGLRGAARRGDERVASLFRAVEEERPTFDTAAFRAGQESMSKAAAELIGWYFPEADPLGARIKGAILALPILDPPDAPA